MPPHSACEKKEWAQCGRNASDDWNGTGMPCLNQSQHRGLFSGEDELLSHLEGHNAAHTKAHQAVRPTGLHFSNLPEEIRRNLLDSFQWLLATFEAHGLKQMHGLIDTEKPGEVYIRKRVAVRTGNQKQWRLKAEGLQRHN
jgi:hypothetical protein